MPQVLPLGGVETAVTEVHRVDSVAGMSWTIVVADDAGVELFV